MLRTVLIAFALLAALVLAAVATGVRIAGNYVRENAYTMGETETARHEFGVDPIDGFRAKIELGAGVLTIGRLEDGASAGIAATVEITDNVVESISRVEYAVRAEDDGQRGTLTVTQDADLKIPDPRQLEAMINRWEIRIRPDIPTEIVIEMGAGELTIRAADLQLDALSVELGTGSGIVDLRGLAGRDLNGAIDSGMGSMEIYLPSDVGVRMQAHSALGSVDADSFTYVEDEDIYVNSAYVPGEPAIVLRVDTGVGSVEVYDE